MSLHVNVTSLREEPLILEGAADPATFELGDMDELIHAENPVRYRLEVQLLDQNLLVRGRVHTVLRCECARCLKSFEHAVDLPEWSCFLPLQGEEAATVENDCVDLTPHLREDIVLALPPNPVCESECPGLRKQGHSKDLDPDASEGGPADVWSELKKLNLE